jgi:trimethylamine:corrinoid methyltransferase-like protein
MKQKLSRSTLILFLFAYMAALAAAQTNDSRNNETSNASPATNTAAAQSANRTSADETFELNITERRINERDFEASTSVEAGEETARGLLLRVGVAVRADEINVLLRNVRGRVRFRASLERVLERLNLRRAPDVVP